MLIYFLYRLLGVLAFPLIVLYIVRRGLRDRRYWRHLRERFGRAPSSWDATVPGGIWLHAVSVGEVVSAVELLRRLRVEFPSHPIYVSVTTVAGREIAEDKLQHLADTIFYAPLDLCWIVRRVLRRLRPRVVVVLETEIWPNLYRESKRFGAGLIIVNGRISDRAWPRYRSLKWLTRAVLSWPDAILVQTDTSLQRYLELGAPPDRTRNNGNLKYDFQIRDLTTPPAISALLSSLQPAPVWIAASTMPPAQDSDPDEDDVIIDAFRTLAPSCPRLLLLLVPRRPERFDDAARKLQQAGIPFLRRSRLTPESDLPLPAVLLIDTMGELSSIFPSADIVFMGGTLVHRGGHNILEPAFFSKPVIIGPHMENFPEIAAEFRERGAVVDIQNPSDLPNAVLRLWQDEHLRATTGETARTLAEARRGATQRAVETITSAFAHMLPRYIPSQWRRLLLGPLAGLWVAGVAFDRRRKRVFAHSLPAPVISVGGIAMGGVGKTPFVDWLTHKLYDNHHRIAILTRGYKRDTPEDTVILAPGEPCSSGRTGDEAQILLRRGIASLGIGANRYKTGLQLHQRFYPEVFVLDDGFQHWALDRDIDLLLLDGLDPFARGAPFPLGRLREPRSALSRASAIIVTRAFPPLPWTALESCIRSYHQLAPIFYSRMEPLEWVSLRGGPALPATGFSMPSAAFCGLGNPASFWSTLSALKIQPRFRWAFGDHTAYRPVQLKRLAEQARSNRATALLTTEKDFINLPANTLELIAPLDLYYLRTTIRLEREDEFLDWLLPRLNLKTE